MSVFELQIADNGLAVVTFDAPGEKVNTVSQAAVAELGDLLVRLAREPRIRALLVRSGKPDVFIAGADIKEFLDIRTDDVRTAVSRVQSLYEQLAHLPYPTVAAIHGVCLGGGTELALACDYRVMSDARKSQIGLPEVKLGIFPAWGGCTRLPRTIGLAPALDLILAGKTLDARRARKVGLVDEAVPEAIFEEWSRDFAREKLGGSKPRPYRGRQSFAGRALEATPPGRRLIFTKARKTVLEQTGGHYPAPLEALEVIEEGYGRPVAVGLESEARHIGLVFGGEVQKNLLRIFFLTEEVKKETGVSDPAVRARSVTRVGVLGAGVMGGGIAQLAADKGLPARMKDIAPQALAHGFASAAAVWREQVKKRRLAPLEMKRRMDRISGALDDSGFARCEVTIEAVVEKLSVKREVLRHWETVVPPEAIFASNTSTLPISEIAIGASVPGRVVGMHFFNPVHRMPLVEVIRGERTTDDTVATIFALAKALGKTPVVVKDAPGFLVNRILAPYLSEAVRLLQDGCRIEDVDAAMTSWGMPVGPLALLDDVGLDVAVKAAEVLNAAFPERISAGGEDALVASGRLGRKNGEGFYDYAGSKRLRPSREAYAALRVKPADKTPLPAEVIQSRLVLPMVNEAAFCLEDEIVRDPARLDLAMIFGTGFPPFRGGLLRWADSLGLGKVFTRLDDLSERLGPRFAPAERIRELANAGRGFYGEAPPREREVTV
ncbi:MAG TPA: 3-hydroxyacyl-CoA dehydrogenase NAD-binding domain-containing protein [Thermoanaerobaculia bacterium]|nr:3-hydroxyacyl-CoA dehydrogenase NAD-binding domain-containing protein [Thermoanaerobaculia bacterium]